MLRLIQIAENNIGGRKWSGQLKLHISLDVFSSPAFVLQRIPR